jgi:alpha-L-arabinofuranosidase
MSLLRHADRVTVACLAQLVNVIGPIRAEPDRSAWAQTIFYPFALTTRHARGDVLRVETSTDSYDTAEHGDVPLVDVVATYDSETGHITVIAMNRHTDEPAQLDVDLRAFGDLTVAEHLYLGGDDLDAVNSIETPERIAPTRAAGHSTGGRRLQTSLPPVSWNLIRLVPTYE